MQVMKPAKILILILLAFVLASVGVYKLHTGSTESLSQKSENSHPMDFDVQTADGRVQSVDVSARKISVIADGRIVVFNFDGSTDFVQDNHIITPSAIVSGKRATVHFTRRGESNIAQAVLISAPE